MKHLSLSQTPLYKSNSKTFIYLTGIFVLFLAGSCNKIRDLIEPELNITVVANGFALPIGVETDPYGRVWVAESGTGNNDGKVSLVTSDGTKHPALVNFESYKIDNGEIEGPAHMLFSGGSLYILGGHGKMYKANVAAFKPGDPAKNASTLEVQDIGAFVLDYNFVNKIYQTHTYGITEGPDDALYITDAASNAVIKRAKNGMLSVLAEVPGIPNPTPVGPPMIESVPTSIYYDGQTFLVTTLLGFPFPPGKARIYKISKTGAVSIHQDGFTTLVDITQGGRKGRLVMEHGQFGQMGFIANTGRLVWANGSSMSELANGLNKPAGLRQVNDHTWYVTSTGDGTLLKVTYK
jgi:hypothetical protein